jgi:hypothetical protein
MRERRTMARHPSGVDSGLPNTLKNARECLPVSTCPPIAPNTSLPRTRPSSAGARPNADSFLTEGSSIASRPNPTRPGPLPPPARLDAWAQFPPPAGKSAFRANRYHYSPRMKCLLRHFRAPEQPNVTRAEASAANSGIFMTTPRPSFLIHSAAVRHPPRNPEISRLRNAKAAFASRDHSSCPGNVRLSGV